MELVPLLKSADDKALLNNDLLKVLRSFKLLKPLEFRAAMDEEFNATKWTQVGTVPSPNPNPNP